MHRLRTTFTRSRTPTGAEMKTQSSLEVPKQVRSASFDEIQLEAQRSAPHLQHQSSSDERATLLQVPQQSSQRSRSFDSAGSDDSGTFLEVPRRFQRRRSSNTKTPPPCIHCHYLEEYERSVSAHDRFFFDEHEVRKLSYSDTSSSEEEIEIEHKLELKFGNTLLPPSLTSPGITFTLSPTNHEDTPPFPSPSSALGSPPILSSPPPFLTSPIIELPLDIIDTPPPRTRRRSISRQEAIFVEPTGNSLENVTIAADTNNSNTVTIIDGEDHHNNLAVDIVRDIYLQVPDLKRDRAASVDSCFSKVSSAGKTEELQPPDGGLTLTVPSSALRSRSVDIVLPTDEQARYKALALAGPSSTSHYCRGATKSTTLQQFDILASFMEEHVDFARGYNSTAEARESAKRLWNEIGNRLNSHGPPIRSSDGWKKVWADFKYNIKKKLKENQQSITGTGGGPSKMHTFSTVEESVIHTINLRAAVTGTPGTISLGDTVLNVPTIPQPPTKTVQHNTNIVLDDMIDSDDYTSQIIQPPSPNNIPNNRANQNKNKLLEEQIMHQKKFHETITSKLTGISEELIGTNQTLKRILRIKEKNYDLKKKKLLLKEREIKVIEMNLEFNKNKLATEAKERLEERKFKVENLELKRRKLELQEANDLGTPK